MTRRLLRPAAALLVLVVSACASGHVRQGDRLVKEKKYEEALIEYRTAEKAAPTNRVLKRIAKAEKKLAEAWVKKGLEARDAGQMAEAADWWKNAATLRKDDGKPGSPRVVIAENASKLEVCGDQSMKSKKWEDSFKCWEALRIAYPDRYDLQQRIEEAHKMFAADLDRDAQVLAKKGLTGAALVLEMRARSHDPLQDGGFEREQQFRKQVAAASLVNIGPVALDDRGHWGLGGYLVPALASRLNSYPPYGPTKSAQATQSVFAATIEEFGWRDELVYGYTRKEVEKPKAAGKEKQPSSERAAQKAIVEKLEKELKMMEAAAAKAAAAVATPAPSEAPEKSKGKGKAGAKEKEKAKEPEKAPSAKRAIPARAPTVDEIAKKRKDYDDARAKLQALPEAVDADVAAAEWYLPWTEVTRVVEARVRFEIREPDFTDPVVKTVTLRVEAKDRAHAADAAHAVAADALELRAVEDMVRELALNLADPGTATIEEARERRADRWIERGRETRNRGDEDQALDMYVRALFAKGIEGGSLPGDAATVVAIRLEAGNFRDIVAGP